MYFRDQGDSLTKAVMVNTQKPAERRERQTDNKEYRVGGGSSVRVIYSDAGQIGCNMLIRRKAFWFPIPKKKKKLLVAAK